MEACEVPAIALFSRVNQQRIVSINDACAIQA